MCTYEVCLKYILIPFEVVYAAKNILYLKLYLSGKYIFGNEMLDIRLNHKNVINTIFCVIIKVS